MLKTHLTFIIRNLWKHKFYTLLNLTGLTIGIASAVIIFSYVHQQLQYDRFHVNHENIYRIITGNIGEESAWRGTPRPLGPALVREYPDFRESIRVDDLDLLVRAGEQSFHERKILAVDPSFFEMFSFQLLAGNPGTLLQSPDEVVLTQSSAAKYFGDENPIGQTLLVDEKREYRITGIVADPPVESHLQFSMLLQYEQHTRDHEGSWGSFNFSTYILGSTNVTQASLTDHLKSFIVRAPNGESRSFEYLNLQPLTDIHFQYIRGNYEPVYEYKFIYLLISVAVVILLIAAINYVNLSTALAPLRSREIGIKKVLGSGRGQLVRQFLAESFLQVALSLALVIGLLEFFLPWLNSFLQIQLDIRYFSGSTLQIFAGIFLIMGLMAGMYPAFFLSKYTPVDSLKSAIRSRGRSQSRNVLVTFQFSVAIFLIAGTLILQQQLHFMKNTDIGLDKEQIVNVALHTSRVWKQSEALKNELLQNPNILQASANSYSPGNSNWHQGVSWEGQTEDERTSMFIISGDKDFFHTFDIGILQGEEQIRNFTFDSRPAYVINRAGLEQIGWDNAVSKRFSIFGDLNQQLLGVMENFNFRSLHHQVQPMVYMIISGGQQISVKMTGNDIQGTLHFIEDTFRRFAPGLPFEYSFFDEAYEQLYRSETESARAILFFTILSIIIAAIGLLGLSSFVVMQRTREIGIRKVLGATSPNIVLLVTREFTVYVLIAMAIAIPAGYWALNSWLQNFAYHVSLSWWVFGLAGLAALLIAVLTVSSQALKAALLNPTETLRYE